MSLIPQETLAQNYWQHACEAKDGAIVYNEKGKVCPFCSTSEPAANTTPVSSKKK